MDSSEFESVNDVERRVLSTQPSGGVYKRSLEMLHCAIAKAHDLPSRALDRKHVEGERQNVNSKHERNNKAGPGVAWYSDCEVQTVRIALFKQEIGGMFLQCLSFQILEAEHYKLIVRLSW